MGERINLFSTEEPASTNVDSDAFNYMLEASQNQNEDLFKEDRELTKVLEATGFSHGVPTGATGMFSGPELSEEAKDNLLMVGALLPISRAWTAGAAVSVRLASMFSALQAGNYKKALISAPFLSSTFKASQIGRLLDRARKVEKAKKLSRAGVDSSDVVHEGPVAFTGTPKMLK